MCGVVVTYSLQSGLSSWTGNTSRVKTSRNQEQTPGSRRPGRSAVLMKTLKRNNDRLGRKIFKIPRPDGCWRRRCWHAHTATINDDPIVPLEPQACGGSVTRQSRRQFSRDIFLSCLSDQPNIACLMIIRGVLHPIFQSYHLKLYY